MKDSVKLSLIFLFLLSTISSMAQTKRDTTISKNSFYNLITIIDNLRGKNFRCSYQLRLQKSVIKVDTIYYGGDSCVTLFFGKANQLLKKEKIIYHPNKTISDSSILIYSDNGLLEYGEDWYKRGDMDWFHLRKYFKNKYDVKGRIIKHAFFLSTPVEKILLYAYDADGQRIRVKNTAYESFWD